MRNSTCIRLLILAIAIFCTLPIIAQNKNIFITPRISFQYDFQKETFKDIRFPFEFKKHTAIQLNWGIDLLFEKYVNERLSIYIGVGYFRNKFNLQRGYNHTLLNIGTDSIGIYTTTHNYTYHLFRVPVGITYNLIKQGKYLIDIGIENNFNFSFKQVYNGAKPFPYANNAYSNFHYYGNSVVLLFNFYEKLSNASSLKLTSYTRVSNIYQKKDKFLYEYDNKPYSRLFDAIGLSIAYSFNSKKSKK